MNEKGSNHQLLKQNNYNLIKKHIYRNSPISRVEIAQQLGLTTATITGMVNPMISSGLLRETAAPSEENKSAGRPRMMLEFVEEAYYACGMDTKTAAANSLYIILFSQAASFISTLITGLPEFRLLALILMVAGGIGGGIVGRKLNKKMDNRAVDKLFIGLMVLIVGICIYNAVRAFAG